MTTKDLLALQPGDQVYWNDPDQGLGSRLIVIALIQVYDDMVILVDRDGSTLECFVNELS